MALLDYIYRCRGSRYRKNNNETKVGREGITAKKPMEMRRRLS